MKKNLITCLITFCLVSIGYSQEYQTGFGIRAGFFNGISLKQFVGAHSAVEMILDTRWKGLEFTGLYEFHNLAFKAKRLKWYYGFGGHVGFWNGNYVKWGTPGTSYGVSGIDGIVGLEYSFGKIPVNIGIDWKPAINLRGLSGFWIDGGALSIRYII